MFKNKTRIIGFVFARIACCCFLPIWPMKNEMKMKIKKNENENEEKKKNACCCLLPIRPMPESGSVQSPSGALLLLGSACQPNLFTESTADIEKKNKCNQ